MIKIENFYKKYDSKSDYVVQNVNLQIEPKKITCLLGPNGSGKSTIMNCICGFIYGSKGSICVSDSNNNLINVEENQSSVMKNIGYVPEISKLPPELKVLEFLTYAAENHNLSKEETLQNIKFLVKKLDLESLLTKKIKTLSKGQQQRVSFAQGLIHNPPNLILDEPNSGLDPLQIKQLRTFIKELSQTKAILMSTHILSEAVNLTSEIYIIKKGKIVKAKDLQNLENEYLEIMENEN